MKIKQQAKLIKNIGLFYYLLGIKERLFNISIQKLYGFDSWHTTGFYHRPYKAQIISIINNLRPNSIIEIGCGLGDIITRANAPFKLGIDNNEQVIKAAKKINRKSNIIFSVEQFSSSSKLLSNLKVNSIDILLMINWPHQISIEEITSTINQIKLNVKCKYIIIDIINDRFKGYKYHHSIKDMKEIGKICKIINSIDGIRNFVIIDCSNK